MGRYADAVLNPGPAPAPQARGKYADAILGGGATPARMRAEEAAPQEFSGYEMLKNIPGSAVEMAGSMVQPIIHPIDTAQAVGNVAAGAVAKLIPGEQDKERYAEQAAQFIKDRYGSIDAFKQTLMEDPVGVLADASFALLGGGGLAARLPGRVGKIGKATQQAGAALDPTNIALNTGKAAIGTTPASLPRTMYESSVKWRPSIPGDERKRLTTTALEEGIMPTSSGSAKLDRLVSGLNSRVEEIINNATNSGTTIPKRAIYTELNKLRRELGGPNIDAPKELRTLNNIVKQFDEYMVKIGKDSLSPQELQTFKQNAYKRINFDLKQGKGSYAKNETKKAMARGARKALENVAPDIKALNAREGALLELQPEIERAANRIENRNIISLDTSAKVGAGAAAGGPAGASLGAAIAAVGNPQVRAYLAIKIAEYQRLGIPDAYIQNDILPALLRETAIKSGEARKSWVDPIEEVARKLIKAPAR